MGKMQIFLSGSGNAHPTSILPSDSNHCVRLLKEMAVPPQASHLLDQFYIMYGGKVLDDTSTLHDLCISDCSTLKLGFRLRGGGGDGGATGAESRDCYLKMYQEKKPDKVDPNEARIAQWSRCSLSSEALKPPCVIDFLGNIYNKEALVNALLTKTLPKRLAYIKGLKDMIPVVLSSIPGIESDDEYCATKFHCPITGQDFNGKFKFVALRRCGHVLSVRALKEVQSTACLICHTQYAENDIYVINGSGEEVNALRRRVEENKSSIQVKKEKKVKHAISEVEKEAKQKMENPCLDTAAVAKGQDELKRKPEIKNDVSVSTTASMGAKHLQACKKFKAMDNIPSNATKSVYASIFTSSSKNTLKETYSCRSLPLGRN